MIKVVNKNSELIKYIIKHKTVRGVSKKIVDFYIEYKTECK